MWPTPVDLVGRAEFYWRKWTLPARHPRPFATHLPTLIGLARLLPIRSVIEFGSGLVSTPAFLDRRLFPHLDTLHSYETNATWYERVVSESSISADARARIQLVSSAMGSAIERNEPAIDFGGASLVFIDDSDVVEERAATIRAALARGLREARNAIYVIHDFEEIAYREAVSSSPELQTLRIKGYTPNVGIAWCVKGPEHSALRRLRTAIARRASHLEPDDADAWIRCFRGFPAVA